MTVLHIVFSLVFVLFSLAMYRFALKPRTKNEKREKKRKKRRRKCFFGTNGGASATSAKNSI